MTNPSQERPASSKAPKRGLGCSLHFQNQDREPEFGSWLYKRPVTISILDIPLLYPVDHYDPGLKGKD